MPSLVAPWFLGRPVPFIVLQCMWKEPAPFNITVNGQLQFVLSSELSSFSVKHGHMCYHNSLNVALPVPTFIKNSSGARDNIVPSLCGNRQKLWQWMINIMFLLWSYWLEKISKNHQNREGIKECINWNLPSLRFALTNFKILNSLDITFSINPQVQSITCFRGLLPMPL